MRKPDHEAVIRFGGEAPRRWAHSNERFNDHVRARVTTTSDRERPAGQDRSSPGVPKLTNGSMTMFGLGSRDRPEGGGGQAARRNGRRAQRSATAWSRSSLPFTTEVRTFSIKCAPLGDQRICC